MLYLIATPIGNLSDLTYRAVETMQKCDYLLCEDTRRSLILLQHYQIHKPLKSYHKFNESHRFQEIFSDLNSGKIIGLLSDGGTPGICDPGHVLIQGCISQKLPFTVIPGACAFINALILSGFPIQPFQFLGFFPKKESEIYNLLPWILSYPGVTVFYESPNRLLSTLSLLRKECPTTQVAIAREITKTFEETIRMTAQEAFLHFSLHPPKGECVLLIQGKEMDYPDPEILVKDLQKTYHLTLTDAIKTAAHLLKTSKQSIYKIFHSTKDAN